MRTITSLLRLEGGIRPFFVGHCRGEPHQAFATWQQLGSILFCWCDTTFAATHLCLNIGACQQLGSVSKAVKGVVVLRKANKNIGKPFFCSLFGALSGTLLYIPFSASNFSENGILLVFIWSTAFLRLSCDFFSIARLCREKHGFLPAAAFSAFVFFAFFCISKTPPV